MCAHCDYVLSFIINTKQTLDRVIIARESERERCMYNCLVDIQWSK